MTRWQWYKPACHWNRICPHGEQSVILDPQDYGPASAIDCVLFDEHTEIFELTHAAMPGLVRQTALSGVRSYGDARLFQFLTK
jgi:hypothetical protein